MLAEFIEFLLNGFRSLGYLGIFALMAIESFLIPFPSEVILIPAGALVALGEMNFWMVVTMGILGSLAGALINYLLAFYLGRRTIEAIIRRHGRFFLLNKIQLEKADRFFRDHGEITTFVGRLIPFVRQIISLPAGFSKMNLGKFIAYTGLGAGVWVVILTYIGYLFGDNLALIEQNKNLASLILILASLIIILLYAILRTKKNGEK